MLERFRRKARTALHRWSSTPLSRERRAVRAGITAHSQNGTLFRLRRNIHRLEKGLTMRPRRDTFAADYISQTLSDAIALFRTAQLSVDSDEGAWVHTVLSEFFAATKQSPDSRIRAACDQWVNVGLAASDAMGPHPAGTVESPVEYSDLLRLAQNRRSVRWFREENVDRSAIDRAVQVAMESPTACNRQPYRFEILDSGPEAARVAAIAMGTAGYSEQIPVLAVVVGDLSAFQNARDRHVIYIDGALASMSFILALEAQNIQSCCINWPDLAERDAQMRKALGLARYERVVMLIAIGHAAEDALVPISAKGGLDAVRRYR